MTTTKKVAGSRSLSKKAAPKKSAVSSGIKKSQAKNNKKTTKKTPKAKAPVKKATKSTKTKKKSPQKLKNNTVLWKSVSEKNKAIGRMKKTISSAPKQKISLVLLSPFQYSINIDSFAIGTARIAGVMMVVLGGIFTVYHAQYIQDIRGLSAQSYLPLLEQGTTEPKENSARTLTYAEDSSATAYDTRSTLRDTNIEKEPPVTFQLNSTEPLREKVAITIKVESAKRVDLLVFKESYTEPLHLGTAHKTSKDTWEYIWNTKDFESGNYKIAADVINIFSFDKTYRDSDATYLALSNEKEIPTEESETKVKEISHSISLHQTDSVTDLPQKHFEIVTKNAESVRLYAYHVASQSENMIGDAYKADDKVWRFRWKTSDYTNGAYTIKAKANYKDGSFLSDPVSVTVTSVVPVVKQKNRTVEISTTTPSIEFSVQEDGVLQNSVPLKVTTVNAKFVEFYAIPNGSQRKLFLGLARNVDAAKWLLMWDTSQTPDGRYRVYAQVKNSYGVYQSIIKNVTLHNSDAVTVRSVEHVEPTDELDSSGEEVDQDEIDTLLREFRQNINSELKHLATAYRADDVSTVKRITGRLDTLAKEIVDSTLDTENAENLDQRVQKRMEKIVSEHKRRAKKAQQLIQEREGADVFKDTDKDGISDYDEENLYHTNPLVADTDNDGFIDGLEVSDGYNPLDSQREIAIQHESPKEMGVVREDILFVDSIESIIPENTEDDADGVHAQALVEGRGLPNSFVTLYIYSTPIIVTVKTESDGSWKYRFDKELEDGTHNIYVGITDNAGRIIAKSEPFAFIKQAQAFTVSQDAVVGSIVPETNDDSLLSVYMVYGILSISVVAIGLVLILLGLHLDARQRKIPSIIDIEK